MPKWDEERQEKKKHPRNQSSATQGMQGDFLHLRKHWVALGAQDRNVGWYVEVAAAIQGDRRD